MHYPSFAIAMALLVAAPLFGQTTLPGEDADAAVDSLTISNWDEFSETTQSRRYWTQVDYLLWWRKPICPKPAVLTTGNPSDADPGALHQPGTQVLLGETRFEFQGASGIRPTIGASLTPDDFLAVEVSGFWLQPVYQHQRFASGANGGPNSYLVYQTPQNAQASIPFSTPGLVAGTSEVVGESFLWGLESNLSAKIATKRRGTTLTGTFLAGGRYLDLTQRISNTNAQWLVDDPSANAMGMDSFAMRNQFAGAQIGWGAGLQQESWSVELIGKIAAGWNHQTNNVQGGPVLSRTSDSPLLMPGPLLAEPSNVGKVTSNRPALVPEIALRLRLALSEKLSVTLGYSLIYLNKALCPGDQMSSVLNPTQLPGNGPVTGSPQPAPIFKETDFFAQGLSAGLEFSF